MMRKATEFTAKIFVDFVRVDGKNGRFDLLNSICEPHNFQLDYDCGAQFFEGRDSIYELLESRVIFILRALKKENFKVLRSTIKATVFDSKIHGELI
jgi:hypothetical protein